MIFLNILKILYTKYKKNSLYKYIYLHFNYIPPIMILLIGICIILTKNPTNPIITKPIPVANAIFLNSIINKYVLKNVRYIYI
jgi:hypothetical protein